MSPVTLKTAPDWHAAAEDLVAGLLALPDADSRISLLERFCERLGQNLYPAFLQVLQVIGRYGEEPARVAVARTLVDALLSGRLPSGHLAAWGASGPSGDPAFGQRRLLGPIEYLCAWYAQPNDRQVLDRARFARVLEGLLDLIASHDQARQLYARKLAADAADPLGGSLASGTRVALAILAEHWSDGAEPWNIASAFLDALDNDRSENSFAAFRPSGGY